MTPMPERILSTAESLPKSGQDDEDAFSPLPAVRPSAADLVAVLDMHGERFRPILAALREQPWKELITSRDLLDQLHAGGLEWSERTLRLYLAEMAEHGLIDRHGRRGYKLTEAGAEIARELTMARRLGAIQARMDETMCRCTFDPAAGTGLVSVNAYVVPVALAGHLCDELEAVFRAGLAVGTRLLLVEQGEDILGREVPAGHIGLGTMCSIGLASVLLRRGIPSQAVFGGLLQMQAGEPRHFLEIIRYDGTTLSPNETFIRANLTSVRRAAHTGTGAITASFREVPLPALPALREVAKECAEAGFPGILQVGRPGHDLLNVPAHDGRVGVILATGLNPVAALWELGHLRGDLSRPMVGPVDYRQLIPYLDLRARLTRLAG